MKLLQPGEYEQLDIHLREEMHAAQMVCPVCGRTAVVRRAGTWVICKCQWELIKQSPFTRVVGSPRPDESPMPLSGVGIENITLVVE